MSGFLFASKIMKCNLGWCGPPGGGGGGGWCRPSHVGGGGGANDFSSNSFKRLDVKLSSGFSITLMIHCSGLFNRKSQLPCLVYDCSRFAAIFSSLSCSIAVRYCRNPLLMLHCIIRNMHSSAIQVATRIERNIL